MNSAISFFKRLPIYLLFIIVLTLCLGALSVILNKALYSDMQPPKNIYTINEFKIWQPSFTKTQKIILNENTIFIVSGDFARIFPSAKSEYYFDKNGSYINWNIDPGDFVTLPMLSLGKREKSNINEVGK